MRYFGEHPSVWVCLMSCNDSTGDLWFGDESHEGKVPFFLGTHDLTMTQNRNLNLEHLVEVVSSGFSAVGCPAILLWGLGLQNGLQA